MPDATALLARLSGDDAIAALTAYLRRQRWFGGRGRDIRGVGVVDAVPLRDSEALALWSVLVQVDYADGDGDRYHLLLSRRPLGTAVASTEGDVRLVAVGLESGEPSAICDALADPGALAEMWDAIRAAETDRGAGGEVRCLNLRMPPEETAGPAGDRPAGSDIRLLGREQSNTSAVRGDRELLKVLRRVSPGISPELELTDALARAGFARIAAPLGAAEYRPAGGGDPTLLAVVQPFLPNGTEGWSLALTSLRALYADVEEMLLPGSPVADPLPAVSGSAALAVAPATAPAVGAEPDEAEVATFAAEAGRLGRVTAEMHLALLRVDGEDALSARPVTGAELAAWSREMTEELDRLLAHDTPELGPVRARRAELVTAFEAIRDHPGGTSIRVHGDYHLGQTLRTDDGWTIIDFEGEPNLPLADRRRHSSALRDVAGMLRSFDYAAAAALAERLDPTDPEWAQLEPRGDAWSGANRAAFWSAYLDTVAGSPLLPEGEAAAVLLRAFELRKAVYETGYELGHRPGWIGIPMRFLLGGRPS